MDDCAYFGTGALTASDDNAGSILEGLRLTRGPLGAFATLAFDGSREQEVSHVVR